MSSWWRCVDADCNDRDIQPGEEVSDSYGLSFIETPRRLRRRRLCEQYRFECGCHACEADFPLFVNSDKVVTPELSGDLGPELEEVDRLMRAGDWAGARARTLRLQASLPLAPQHAVMLRCRSVRDHVF